MKKHFKIGITGGRMFERYANWVLGTDPDIELIRLDYQQQNIDQLSQCSGLVLTGGEDVHPRYYGKNPDYLRFCPEVDFDERRDEFELELLGAFEKHTIPLLGICRGLQVYNVYRGGTLVPDLPSWGKFNHAKLPNGLPRDHRIFLDPNSNLYRLIGKAEGIVNSLHHQSADRIGNGLVTTAVSPDDVVEALEAQHPGSYLYLVQWHPERMPASSPFVEKLRQTFIESTKQVIIE